MGTLTQTPDRPLLGILLMVGFCVVIPFSDALAKVLGADFPLLQLVVVRFATQAILFVPLAVLAGINLFPSRRVLGLTLLRACLQIAGLLLMFSALRVLPLADAVAIAFVMPFLMLLLGRFFLDEEVGPRRLIACAVGFIGTLMVVQPSFAAVGWAALLPIGVAFAFAFFMLVTRAMSREIDPLALQGASGLVALPLVVPFLFFPVADVAPLAGWVTPQGAQVWLLVALGIFGSIGHLLMTWSLRYAPSATLAPMQYLEIPVATLVGFAMFSDLPNGLAAMGIAVTIASGLYIVFRERALSRALAAEAAAPAVDAASKQASSG
ncbi:DMT family transporter [Rhodobacteraceae bacterium N5(2021)]|uniref:DMT family transporter n=1 Tax=Gymnodinialimonas phycosphaerae TaxID=2841589 RepID=A0A975TQK7_9RHOB|nr:DMT family transporter [Gymnodinialimonas phycosphaerae]MBY4893263.1 DMT family transporter [Gymnodinialimonas phycosphaerae]